MEMSIDEHIKRMGDIRNNYDRWSVLGLTPNEAKAFDFAIDTMRKYQKIKDIYYHQTGRALEDSLRSVIEDGETNSY